MEVISMSMQTESEKTIMPLSHSYSETLFTLTLLAVAACPFDSVGSLSYVSHLSMVPQV